MSRTAASFTRDAGTHFVTVRMTFQDPKHENHRNYYGNRGNYQVIRNQLGKSASTEALTCGTLTCPATSDRYLALALEGCTSM